MLLQSDSSPNIFPSCCVREPGAVRRPGFDAPRHTGTPGRKSDDQRADCDSRGFDHQQAGVVSENERDFGTAWDDLIRLMALHGDTVNADYLQAQAESTGVSDLLTRLLDQT